VKNISHNLHFEAYATIGKCETISAIPRILATPTTTVVLQILS